MNTAVIGYGYWGPNIVRNFNAIEDVQVISVCDKNPNVLKVAKKTYPSLKVTTDFNEITSSPDIDIVAIVTPIYTHFELAKKSLENGKHIFVEKPFTATVDQAEELIELADKKNLKIMVDHTFLFTGAIRKIKELIDSDMLGNLYYYDSMRVNLGLFQHDVNVIWDLAPHDLSIMDYVIGERPDAIMASGKPHFNGFEDIAFITVYFTNNMIAHFNVNWLSPVKIRTTLIGGEKRMLVWNDLDADEKIKVYDKGVKVENQEGIYDLLVSYRSGDMWAPKVSQTEALKAEAEYFVDCILNDKTPFNDGHAGLRVVKMLEASNKSLKHAGKMIKL
ncbi:MAG: Gfo/Idh/MocA family oxidoreductase [Deltaproteobacteria bacterium]|nr:Gfo/Idh/MocA family oxidoreductase [Deltaproteobacteria bacterium]